MINVQVIDNTKTVEQCIVSAGANLVCFSDEVRALNVLEQGADVEEQPQPSVVLLNYSVRAEGTAEYIKLLLNANAQIKIVVIGSELSEDEELSCLMSGAKGYQEIKQLKKYAEKLITVIDDGEAWITRRMVAILLDRLRA